MTTKKFADKTAKNQAMSMISLRLPKETVDSLKEIAPQLGFAGYQPLIRAYIAQGLQADLTRLSSDTQIDYMAEKLKQQGIDEKLIKNALAETRIAYAVNPMPNFIAGMAVVPATTSKSSSASPTAKSWGETTADLLMTLDTVAWEEAVIDAPVAWVDNMRRQRREQRDNGI